jgi:hypothetical protein
MLESHTRTVTAHNTVHRVFTVPIRLIREMNGQLWRENFRIKNRKPSHTPMAKTVLIVEDNAFVRRALRKLLTRELGVEISEAQNGKEAINKARELQPDFIVLDVSMPQMNGLEAARRLRVCCLRCRSFYTAPSLKHSQRKRLTRLESRNWFPSLSTPPFSFRTPVVSSIQLQLELCNKSLSISHS